MGVVFSVGHPISYNHERNGSRLVISKYKGVAKGKVP